MWSANLFPRTLAPNTMTSCLSKLRRRKFEVKQDFLCVRQAWSLTECSVSTAVNKCSMLWKVFTRSGKKGRRTKEWKGSERTSRNKTRWIKIVIFTCQVTWPVFIKGFQNRDKSQTCEIDERGWDTGITQNISHPHTSDLDPEHLLRF